MQDLASEKLNTEQGAKASPTKKPTASTFDFMVVSNRLPVDRISDDNEDRTAGVVRPAAWSQRSRR